jgi:hypothetical protein
MNLPVMKSLVLVAAFVALPALAASAKAEVKPAAVNDAAVKDDVKPAAVNDTSAAVPDAVKAYAKAHAGDPFPYSGPQIRVGRPIEPGETWRAVPDYPAYRFTNLGGQVVVIDAKSSMVVAIY